MPESTQNKKSKFKTLYEVNHELPSGFKVLIQKKESPEGALGISIANKRFFFPVKMEDVESLTKAMVAVSKQM